MTNVKNLALMAHNEQKYAYCPYSGYEVGCVIELSNGVIMTGANVENASYGLTMCAERNAVFKFVQSSLFKTEVIQHLVYASMSKAPFGKGHHSPCGACLQVMTQFMKPEALVSHYDGKSIMTWQFKELLPMGYFVQEGHRPSRVLTID